MNNHYIISEWALIRRNELVDIPVQFEIHPHFLKSLDASAFEAAFRAVWDLFYQLYTDISAEPEQFGMPLYDADTYKYGSKEAAVSRTAAWNVCYLLLYIFTCGSFEGGCFIVNADAFRSVNRIQTTHYLFKALCDYGFVFDGLRQYKLTAQTKEFSVDYPANRNILTVLSLTAKKVSATQPQKGWNHFSNSFISWNYKILKDGPDIAGFGSGSDYVADHMHNEEDRSFIVKFHEIMEQTGHVFKHGCWNEGPCIRYYDKPSVMNQNGPYLFRVLSWKGELRLMIRIRNAEACMQYLDSCSEHIKDMFRHSDTGCQNRINGTCTKHVQYQFEGNERWHCGCCSAAFQLHPRCDEIQDYLYLAAIGAKK